MNSKTSIDNKKQHSIFVEAATWNTFKTWCVLKGINITEKGGEVISYFVKTTCEPDLRKRNLVK